MPQASLSTRPRASRRASPKAKTATKTANGAKTKPARKRPARLKPDTIDPRRVEALNAVYRHRPPLDIAVADTPMRIETAWPPPDDDAAGRCTLAIAVDGAQGTLGLPRALVAQWIAQIDPDAAPDSLAPEHAALLVECALAADIARLEEALGHTVEIASVTDRPPEGMDMPRFGFSLAWAERTAALALALPCEHAAGLGALLDRLAPGRPADPELPVPVSLCAGAADLTVAELRGLVPGDVVLAEEARTPEATALALIAGHLAAPAVVGEAGAKLVSGPFRLRGSNWEWIMTDPTHAAAISDDTDLDDLPVRLTFELGRTELALSDVRALAPGALLPLSRPVDEAVDVIANGRRIGRGELVRIGESLGIRITRLADNA